MTEDEAKTKWCPFARVAMVQSSAASAIGRTAGMVTPNRGADADGNVWIAAGSLCIATACMAWHWDKWEHPEGLTLVEGVPVGGHCGLTDSRSAPP